MGNRTIIFYAPVGTNVPVYMLGGGEKGCRRTREILSNAGYDVITIDKATMSHGAISYVKSAIHAIIEIKKDCMNILRLFFTLLDSMKKIYL